MLWNRLVFLWCLFKHIRKFCLSLPWPSGLRGGGRGSGRRRGRHRRSRRVHRRRRGGPTTTTSRLRSGSDDEGPQLERERRGDKLRERAGGWRGHGVCAPLRLHVPAPQELYLHLKMSVCPGEPPVPPPPLCLNIGEGSETLLFMWNIKWIIYIDPRHNHALSWRTNAFIWHEISKSDPIPWIIGVLSVSPCYRRADNRDMARHQLSQNNCLHLINIVSSITIAL